MGANLTKAFMQIRDPKVRRSIVNLIEQIADSADRRGHPDSSFRGARLRANPESRVRCEWRGRLDSGFAAAAAPRNDQEELFRRNGVRGARTAPVP
jgi:hypothetical protein